MAVRIPWDKFEVALLIDIYLQVAKNELPKKETIHNLSKVLRQKAINLGLEIDLVYRNTNGIAMRFANIQYLFTNGKLGLSSYSLLDKQMYELYQKNFLEFSQVLEEAKKMVYENKKNEDLFLSWLSSKVSPAQLSELYMAYEIVNEFCKKTKVLQATLFETTDPTVLKKVQQTIEQNKIFRFKHKRQIHKIISALRYYFTYVKENEKLPNNDEINKKTLEPFSAFVETKQTSFQQKTDSKELSSAGLSITRNTQDEKLMDAYPVIYKRVYVSLQKATEIKGNLGVTAVAIYENIRRTARFETVKEILDGASWAKINGAKYIFSETVFMLN